MTDNIVQMTYHVAILHEETLRRFYEISKKHQNLVQKILTTLQPAVYKSFVQSFSRLDLIEVCYIYYTICYISIIMLSFKQFRNNYH